MMQCARSQAALRLPRTDAVRLRRILYEDLRERRCFKTLLYSLLFSGQFLRGYFCLILS